MFKCIGHSHSQGSMVDERTGEPFSWNNEVFHVVSDTDPDVLGMSANQIKIKADEAPSILGTRDFSIFVDREVEPITALRGKKIVISGIRLVNSNGNNSDKRNSDNNSTSNGNNTGVNLRK